MARGPPFPAFWLGLGSLIPSAACAAGAFIGPAGWRGLALAATAEAETRHARARRTLGVVPARSLAAPALTLAVVVLLSATLMGLLLAERPAYTRGD